MSPCKKDHIPRAKPHHSRNGAAVGAAPTGAALWRRLERAWSHLDADDAERVLRLAERLATNKGGGPRPSPSSEVRRSSWDASAVMGDRASAETERRDSDARPFKCPKPVYNAVALAVGSTPEPQTFQTIKRHAQRQIGGPLADYAVRTPLRYWSVLGLVHHDQARFTRVGTKAEFTRRVRDAWKTSSRQEVHTDPDSCGQLRGRNSKS